MNIKTIIGKIFNIKENLYDGQILACPIYLGNDNVGMVHKACKVCVNGAVSSEYADQLKNISNVVGLGHESIMEHSNIVILLEVSDNYAKFDMAELFSCLRFLRFKVYELKGKTVVVIGGSIRGYKYIFQNIANQNNIFLPYIKQCLYDLTPKEFYKDLIDANIVEENKFISYVKNREEFPYEINTDNVETDRVSIEDISDFNLLKYAVKDITGIDMPTKDILEFCTISILFKNPSRTASHQLVRHRNAISQESQRYVDYGKALFVDPVLEEKNTDNTRYDITIFGQQFSNISITDMANLEISLYSQLRATGMSKENARAILPNNVCTKLYMTFTFDSIIRFIQLRTDPAAQAEIRNIANDVKKLFLANVEQFIGLDIYEYIKPSYLSIVDDLQLQDDTIDEPFGEIMTSEEIIKICSEVEDDSEMQHTDKA